MHGIFFGLGDQPTGPKYEVWQGFFLIVLLGLTPGGIPCFILFILFENMIRQITILAKETKSLNEKGREGGSSKLNDVAKKLPAHTVQLKMTAAVVLSTRDQTSKSSYSTALCAVRKVYFSAQPNKLRPILKFRKYFPVEHIFVPACSSVRKIHFFKF